jgi:hypothetical protein
MMSSYQGGSRTADVDHQQLNFVKLDVADALQNSKVG